MTQTVKENFVAHIKGLQDKICAKMKEYDPELGTTEDIWERKDHVGGPGGGGRTRALKGKLFENAGVNISNVYGKINPEFAKKIGSDNDEMWAAGISLILHPFNPKVPTVHANFRMIQGGSKIWFGGGADLTPYYPHLEDFEYFHGIWKKACEPYGVYSDYKKQCDEYFCNHHRQGEMRGVSGIFFDHHNSGDLEKDYAMVTDLSNHFIDSYFPIVEKRCQETFSSEDEDFQLHRRGRYVEFNLLHDRGTHFGLKTKGRVESILISLPGRVKFSYDYKPKAGSVHEKMMDYYWPKDY